MCYENKNQGRSREQLGAQNLSGQLKRDLMRINPSPLPSSYFKLCQLVVNPSSSTKLIYFTTRFPVCSSIRTRDVQFKCSKFELKGLVENVKSKPYIWMVCIQRMCPRDPAHLFLLHLPPLLPLEVVELEQPARERDGEREKVKMKRTVS